MNSYALCFLTLVVLCLAILGVLVRCLATFGALWLTPLRADFECLPATGGWACFDTLGGLGCLSAAAAVPLANSSANTKERSLINS